MSTFQARDSWEYSWPSNIFLTEEDLAEPKKEGKHLPRKTVKWILHG